MTDHFIREKTMSFARFAFASATLALLSATALAEETAPAAKAPDAPAAAASPAAPAAAAPAANAGSQPVTRAEIPALVKEALTNDPDILMSAIAKLRDKQAAEAKKQEKEGLAKNKAALFSDDSSPSTGAANPDITIAEFFDYHCGYCRHQLPVIKQLVGEDKKIRVVFKEFPILSEDSVLASRAALAVNNIAKDKYFDFHQALMAQQGKFDEKVIMDIAKRLGINTGKLKTEMDKPEITAALDKNRAIAEDLGIHGTPAIVIGDEMIPGAIDYDGLKKAIADQRTKG